MYKFLQYAAIVSLLCLFGSNVVVAQNAPQNLTQCQNASSLTTLNSTFEGQWYEVLRNPASQSSCVGLNIYSNVTGMYLGLTTPKDSNALYLNQTTTYKLTAVGAANSSNTTNLTASAEGYSYPTGNNVTVTIKILKTDSSNYAVLCGYNSNSNSSFGLVLTRQRVVTNASLTSYVEQVNSTYAGFADLKNVNQSPVCYQSSAATHVSALSLVFAIIYAAIKFIN